MFSFLGVMSVFIPIVMIVVAVLWKKYPPKTINALYGYRTARSMKSREAWDFAQRYCGKLFLWCGAVVLGVSLAAFAVFLLLWSGDIRALGIAVSVLSGVQVLALFVPIFPTERELKKRFDTEDRRGRTPGDPCL